MLVPLFLVPVTVNDPIAKREIVAIHRRAPHVHGVESESRIGLAVRTLSVGNAGPAGIERPPALRPEACAPGVNGGITSRVGEHRREVWREIAQQSPACRRISTAIKAHLRRSRLSHHTHATRADPIEIAGHAYVSLAFNLQWHGGDVVT